LSPLCRQRIIEFEASDVVADLAIDQLERPHLAHTDLPVNSHAGKIRWNDTWRYVDYGIVLELHLADFGHIVEILEKILLKSGISVPAECRHPLIEQGYFLGFTGESLCVFELFHIDKEEVIDVSENGAGKRLSWGMVRQRQLTGDRKGVQQWCLGNAGPALHIANTITRAGISIFRVV
jgi:hypothetical protein